MNHHKSFQALGFSKWLINAFDYNRIYCMDDLKNYTLTDLKNMDKFGSSCMYNFLARLKAHNIALDQVLIPETPEVITKESNIKSLGVPVIINNILNRNSIFQLNDFRNYTLNDISIFKNLGYFRFLKLIAVFKDNGINIFDYLKSRDTDNCFMIEIDNEK